MKKWIRWFRLILPFIAFAGLFFMIGFIKNYHLPKLKSLILIEIERQSHKHSPIRVWPKNLNISLYPLGVELSGVRLLPQKELKGILKPTIVKEAKISLNLFELLKGRIRLKELYIAKGNVSLLIKEPNKNTPPFKINWDELYALPIDTLKISEINLDLFYKQSRAQLKNINLDLENQFKAITVDFRSPQIFLKQTPKEPEIELDVKTQFLIEEDGLYFSGLRIKKGKSFVLAAGAINGNTAELKFNKANLKTRTHINLKEAKQILQTYVPKKTFPKATGRIELDLEIEAEKKKDPKFNFKMNTFNVEVEKFEVGNVFAEGTYSNKVSHIKNVKLRHSGGNVLLTNGKIKFDKNIQFNTQVEVKKIDLQKLLAGLRIPNVPVISNINGKLPCSGSIKPSLLIQCRGGLNIYSLDVYAGEKQNIFNIVNIKNAKIDGSVTVTNKFVKYNSEINIGDSSGTSSGNISYDKGFKIKYASEKLNFKDIENVAQLKMEGVAAVSGSTQGNTSHATIDMNVKANDFWLEDFKLGQFNSNLRYKEGILNFRSVAGAINNSRYRGNLAFNLLKQRLFLDMDFPFVSAIDIKKSVERRMPIPVPISGTGSAKLKLRGPFKVDQLTYNLESSLYRGSVADETFDQLIFNVTSKSGHLKTNEVVFTKSKSRMEASGQITSDKQIDLIVRGKNFQIEQSENISKLKLKVAGRFDFGVGIKGPLPQPTTKVSGRFSHIFLGDTPVEDSEFQLEINQRRLKGQGEFWGKSVTSNFLIPFHKNSPLKLSMKSNKWDFTPVFGLFSGSGQHSSFDSSVTSNFQLVSENGNIFDAKGSLDVTDFHLQRGSVYLKSKEPMKLTYDRRRFNAQNCKVSGINSYMELKTPPSSKFPLNMDLNGKLNLSLLSFLTPFLEELRGDLSLAVNVSGRVDNPSFLGSSYVQNAFLRFQGLPQPIDQLSADVLFSQKSILINSVKGRIGNGQLTSGGYIKFIDLKTIPINIRGNINSATFNVPEGFKTTGTGEFSVEGKWFPYTLNVDHTVYSGKVQRNLSQVSSDKKYVQPSEFLPKFLLQDSFSPIRLNAIVKLKNEIPVDLKVGPIDINTPISGRLVIKGPPTSPKLTGRLKTGDGGEVTFRSNTFEIRSGIIEYANSEPENPKLVVSGNAQVTDNKQNQYDVDLFLQGTAQKPEISLSSQPPLPEQKIISLLALGVLDDAGGDQKEFDTSIFTRDINEELQKRVGVQFKVITNIDAENDAEHTVTIKKQWSPKFGAAASRSFGKRSKDKVKVEYKLNKSVSLVGKWEKEEQETSSDVEETLGLDLEYKLEFK